MLKAFREHCIVLITNLSEIIASKDSPRMFLILYCLAGHKIFGSLYQKFMIKDAPTLRVGGAVKMSHLVGVRNRSKLGQANQQLLKYATTTATLVLVRAQCHQRLLIYQARGRAHQRQPVPFILLWRQGQRRQYHQRLRLTSLS